MLKELLKLIPDSKLLIGETPQTERDKILNSAGKEVKAILTTKIFDEGISCHRLDTIFLTCPNNNPIKLEQRVGRIIRLHPDKKDPLIVDFWLKGHIVQAQQSKRVQWYLIKGFKPVEAF
jgi:superfamily II DNA or RNA helicase